MASTRECAAWKVLYYARIYSGNKVHNISQNMTSIRGGYSSSIGRMAAAMTNCNKCGTTACENLAKQVAHAWLKANRVPDNTVAGSGTSAPAAGCSTPASSMKAAHKVAYYINFYGGVDLQGNKFTNYNTPSNNTSLLAIINGYKTGIATIRNGLSCKDHNKCATQVCENTAKLVAQAWLKSNPYRASGGTIKPPPAPRPTGTDSDCYHWGGDWLGGLLDGVCIGGKSVTKGGSSAFQNPINQYMPLMLLGLGGLALIMFIKK